METPRIVMLQRPPGITASKWCVPCGLCSNEAREHPTTFVRTQRAVHDLFAGACMKSPILESVASGSRVLFKGRPGSAVSTAPCMASSPSCAADCTKPPSVRRNASSRSRMRDSTARRAASTSAAVMSSSATPRCIRVRRSS